MNNKFILIVSLLITIDLLIGAIIGVVSFFVEEETRVKLNNVAKILTIIFAICLLTLTLFVIFFMFKRLIIGAW